MATPALKLIVPTSVSGTGVSVSATGKITLASSSTVNVNGVFSAAYDDYLIVQQAVNSAGDTIKMRMRAAGTDATGSNYTHQFLNADGASVTSSRSTSSNVMHINIFGSGGRRNGHHVYVYGPFLARNTIVRSITVADDSNGRIYDNVAEHSLSTSYDGFSIFNTNNMTGTLTVYGLAQ